MARTLTFNIWWDETWRDLINKLSIALHSYEAPYNDTDTWKQNKKYKYWIWIYIERKGVNYLTQMLFIESYLVY